MVMEVKSDAVKNNVAEVYEGRGLFRQEITAMSCPDCHTIQNIVVGGIIADVAPSYRS